MSRSVDVNQALVSHVPGDTPFASPGVANTSNTPGVEAFNSNQFRQGLAAGPKVGLSYLGDSGYGAEVSYFNVLSLSAAKAIGRDGAWLVMKAPGSFWQTQDFSNQAMEWKLKSSLYSVEANGRLTLSSRVTVLAGLRWLQLDDTLQGVLTPPDTAVPNWKYTFSTTFAQVPPMPASGSTETFPPFWTTRTTNNLYGVQVGADIKVLELGRLSLDGMIKAGIFNNNASQSTVVSMRKVLYGSNATTNNAAFVGEANVRLSWRIAEGLAFKVGYEALLFRGVALAPGQIRKSYTAPASVQALGVNAGSSAHFQGFTAGLQYSF